MKKTFIVVLATVCFVVSVFLLASCGKKDGADANANKVIRVMWWGNQTRAANTQAALKVYEAENPGVTFEVEFADWNGYWDKVATLAASGDLPDIIQMDYAYLAQYAGKNLLAPLDEYLGSAIDTTDIPRSIIDSGAYKGKVYALCAGMNAPCVVYDKEAVAAAGITIDDSKPLTWEEFFDIARAVNKATGKKVNMYGDTTLPIFLARDYDLWLFGRDAENPQVSPEAEQKAVLRFFDISLLGAQEGWMITPALRAEYFTAGIENGPFAKGITWTEFTFSNLYPTFEGAAKRDVGMLFLPQNSDATTANLFLKPGQFFSMTATSKNKDEAAKVLNFLTNSEKAQDELKAERGVPISSKMSEYIKPSVSKSFQDSFDYVVKTGTIATPIDNPDPKGISEVRKIIENLRDRVELGQITPKDAASQWVKEANEVLTRTK